MGILLVISLVVNLLLALAFFFKDSINKLIFHKIETFEKRKVEERELLKRFRNLLIEYNSNSHMYAIYAYLYFKTINAECKHLVDQPFQETKVKYELINKALSELKPDLDKAMRERFDSYASKVQGILLIATGAEKFIKGMRTLSQEDFIKETGVVLQEGTVFTKEIENIINR